MVLAVCPQYQTIKDLCHNSEMKKKKEPCPKTQEHAKAKEKEKQSLPKTQKHAAAVTHNHTSSFHNDQ